MGELSHTSAATENDGLLLLIEQVGTAHDRHRSEHSDHTSSQNSAGDDGENRDLNLPKE
ncbi:hypothetical protein [Nocardiopsis sp. JB363]|uniref:hypothetical protein n=1 Tax=Nocardiopsis sp. JB363 TaxID=1434837 RepID=UPI000979FF4D|nr:hypothetical protein [Nocardiopsis sp. JB363]SIO91360.1 hypothetical protein BQ8420_31340 [Nocardiopsis sp. JB363]